MANKIQFRNGDPITAGHLRVSLQIIAGLMSVLLALISFIYINHITRQDVRDLKQDTQMTILLEAININSISVDAINKYILLKDGVDLEAVIEQHTWDQLHDKLINKSRTRSIKFRDPEYDYSSLAVEH